MIGVPTFQAPANLFLMNPKHDGFITGEQRKFDDMGFRRGCILYGFLSVFFFIAIGMGVTAIHELNVRAALDQSGITTTATITNHRSSTSRDRKGHTSTTYYITYEFHAGPANSDYPALYTSEHQVSKGIHDSAATGSTLDVRYLPDDPTVSRLVNDGTNNPIVLLIATILFVAIPLFIMYGSIQVTGRNRRLVKEGQLLTGRITEATLRKVKSNYQLTVNYTFRTPEGEELTKMERRVRNDLQTAVIPAPGTPVAVMYISPKIFRVL